MKILSAIQMNKVDAETMKDQHISSIDLMERAATAIFDDLKERHSRLAECFFYIFCGKGNNGGDGLVLARLLDQQHAKVVVYLLEAAEYATDNLINQKRLPHGLVRKFNAEDRVDIPADVIVVDCLLGYGLKGLLDQRWYNLVESINHSGSYIYAVDVPSGLLADESTGSISPVVKADFVYTFQSPKLGLLMPENQSYVKEFKVLDIGLSTQAYEQMDTSYFFVDQAFVRSFYRKRRKFDHKGVFGHTLLIGGSKGKMGAVQLASKAALRAGAGLLSTYIPCCGYTSMQTAVPEAMVLCDPGQALITQFPEVDRYQSIGIGIGMGTGQYTVDALKVFIAQGMATPFVLDADALNILASDPALWDFIPKHSILTPHPKELSRIIGTWQTDFEKLVLVKEFSAKHQLYIVVKGANSAIVAPDGSIYFNSSGNVGMATGGSGDILTGMVSALVGQGYSSKEALLMGVYLHGRAADIAVRSIGVYSLLPSDIIDYLCRAFLELEQGS